MNLNNSKLNNKAQIGFEFLLLSVFLFLGVGVALGVAGYFIAGFNLDNLDKEREDFVQTIIREFENAITSPNNMRRGFEIPFHLLDKYEIIFIENQSVILVRDYRKHGFDSDVEYYYEIGDIFRFNQTFYVDVDVDGNRRISFDLVLSEEVNRLDLAPFSSTIFFNELLFFNSFTPLNNFVISLGENINVGLDSTIEDDYYSFVNFDNSLVGWWRFEDIGENILFEDNFENFDGWNQYLGGVIEHSSEQARFGTHSLKKTTNSFPRGGYKLIGEEIDRNFIMEYWIRSDDPRPSSNGDRVSIINSNNEGYGVRISSTGFALEEVYNNTWDSAQSISPLESWARPENEWYRVRLESKTDGFLNASLFLIDGTYVGSVTTSDTSFQNFDRVHVRGGYDYYVDGIRIFRNVIEDESGNNNHGIIYGATLTDDGKFGGAMEFDGVGGSIINSSLTSSSLSDVQNTVSLWIKPSTLSGIKNLIVAADYDNTRMYEW
ncbi:MAG: hypothetical protein LAT82_01205, partial [Nanoarchaeota archaeon]|nr:hypothetical protein [Nanoarchaeota archaeon]